MASSITRSKKGFARSFQITNLFPRMSVAENLRISVMDRCNFRCGFCQNWEISQSRPEDVKSVEMFPAEVREDSSMLLQVW